MPIFSLGERRIEFRGDRHYIAHDATLAGSIVLENDVSIWFGVVIRADNDQVTIGEACRPGLSAGPGAKRDHRAQGHAARLHSG